MRHSKWGRARLAAGLSAALSLSSPAVADPAMWTVRDADTTVHLLGTIHLLEPGTDWRSEDIEAAIAAADTLWLEIDLLGDTSGSMAMITKGTSPGTALKDRLDPADYAEVAAAAGRAGVPMTQLEHLRPWLVSISLSLAMIRQLGYDAAGVDLWLAKEAASRRIAVRAFETGAEQIDIFAAMSEEDEIAMLMQAVRATDEELALFGQLFDAWVSGDSVRLGDLMTRSVMMADPAMGQALIGNRNRAWAERFAEIMAEPGTRLVAVGAGHLVGPEGLPELLRAKGWEVEEME